MLVTITMHVTFGNTSGDIIWHLRLCQWGPNLIQGFWEPLDHMCSKFTGLCFIAWEAFFHLTTIHLRMLSFTSWIRSRLQLLDRQTIVIYVLEFLGTWKT